MHTLCAGCVLCHSGVTGVSMLALFYAVLTYLVCSIPTGSILAALYADVDLRDHGSGNIGATNAARVLGKGIGAATLVGDLAKGLLMTLGASAVSDAGWYPGVIAGCAFLGHCFSAYLNFRGGKGVATTAGALLVLAPWPTVLTMGAWGLVVGVTRKSSLGALTAVFVLPLLVAWMRPSHALIALLLAFGVAVRHADNVKRILAGTER